MGGVGRAWSALALGAALLTAGCGKGDTLVVITVDATPPISGVALLHAMLMAGGQSHDADVGTGATPFALGGGVTKTFAVQVPASLHGAFTVHVEARDQDTRVLATGDGTATLAPGMRVNLPLTLNALPIVAEPVWIGSGGSASVGGTQLNVGIGAVDTTGAAAAPSGAAFISGFFASQTY